MNNYISNGVQVNLNSIENRIADFAFEVSPACRVAISRGAGRFGDFDRAIDWLITVGCQPTYRDENQHLTQQRCQQTLERRTMKIQLNLNDALRQVKEKPCSLCGEQAKGFVFKPKAPVFYCKECLAVQFEQKYSGRRQH